MKRLLAVLVLSLSLGLAPPAQAIAPLAALVLHFVKDAVRKKVISMVEEQVEKHLPGGHLLTAFARGGPSALLGGWINMSSAMAQAAAEPRIAEARAQFAALQAGDATPLSEQEWQEYRALVRTASGNDADAAEGVESLRASIQQFPQMAGMVRKTLNQMRDAQREKQAAFAAYATMSEDERGQIVTAFVDDYRKLDREERDACLQALQSGAMEMPGDLGQRLVAALKAA